MYEEAPKVLGIRQIQVISAWGAILGAWGVVWLFEPYHDGKLVSETQIFFGLLAGVWIYWFVSQYLFFYLNGLRREFLHPPKHLYEVSVPDAFEKLCDYLAMKQINFGDKWRKELVDQQNNRIHYAISWVTERLSGGGKGRTFYKNHLRLSIKLSESASGNTWIKYDWEPLSEYDYNALDSFIEATQKELDELLQLGLFAPTLIWDKSKPPAPPVWLLFFTALSASIWWLAFITQGWVL